MSAPTASCRCGATAVRRVVSKESANKGRPFYACPRGRCGFFLWALGDGPSTKSPGRSFSSSSFSSSSTTTSAAARSAALFIYTDGACKDNANVAARQCEAGWGVVVLKPRDRDNRDDDDDLEVMQELHGPVVLSASDERYLGADYGSNNSAELSAIGEALRWLRDDETSKASPVVFRYDSQYAAMSVMGQYNGAKNAALIANIRKLLREVQAQRGGSQAVIWEHVRGHSNNRWNDRADTLATMGSQVGRASRSARRKRSQYENDDDRYGDDTNDYNDHDYNAKAPRR